MEKYVDFEWYSANFLMERPAVIPEELFDYYIIQASAEVKNRITLGADMSNPPDEVKAAVCDIAEILCRGDGKDATGETTVIPEGVSSEKVGEYSVSYTGTSAAEKAATKSRQISSAMVKWLGPTGLLFRGV